MRYDPLSEVHRTEPRPDERTSERKGYSFGLSIASEAATRARERPNPIILPIRDQPTAIDHVARRRCRQGMPYLT
jgi:hypothetical protein